MASSRSECPKCLSSKNVRLRGETTTAFRYWCNECRLPFEKRKYLFHQKPKKEK